MHKASQCAFHVNQVLLRRALFVLDREDEMQVGLTSEEKQQLRGCCLEQLLASKFSRGNSAYRGVSYHKTNRNFKYRARISDQGKNICLGSFATEEDAAHAYDKAARCCHTRYTFAAEIAIVQHRGQASPALHLLHMQGVKDVGTLNCVCRGRLLNSAPQGNVSSVFCTWPISSCV